MQWHNRRSVRLQGYDYSSDGLYFVTICTKNRKKHFGNIVCRDMIYRVLLNQNGRTADKYWKKIPEYFPFAKLDEYVIMPNHIHGIIKIEKSGGISLSKIIRWVKGRISHEIHRCDGIFSWQSRFYDTIIGNNRSLYAIRQYIRDNPKNWEYDGENIDVITENI